MTTDTDDTADEALRLYRAFRRAALTLPALKQHELMKAVRAVDQAGDPIKIPAHTGRIAGRPPDKLATDLRRPEILAVVAERPGLTVRQICEAIFGTADVAMFETIHKVWDECFQLARVGKVQRDTAGRYWPGEGP